jgi:hypothetical protein
MLTKHDGYYSEEQMAKSMEPEDFLVSLPAMDVDCYF